MKEIVWGIIGCGNVTEVKSGPAFNKVSQSRLYAVMRRDIAKAEDYARRHNVPKFYGNANDLINDSEVNAIYIATPPNSHEQYCLAAIAASKSVYVEKPMAIGYLQALNIKKAAEAKNVKLSVAHYRNTQPYFNAIKQYIELGKIGEIRQVELKLFKPALTEDQLKEPGKYWRINPLVSGGGLFHDLAPHQFGILLYYFGDVENVTGTSSSIQKKYLVDDKVDVAIDFKNGIQFFGQWDFAAEQNIDECIIKGALGTIHFSFFGKQEILLTQNNTAQLVSFTPPQHVQQPHIEKVVQYFLGQAGNPCSAHEGTEVMRIIEICTQ